MGKNLKEEIKENILRYGALSHVYISKGDAFFLFKNPGQPIEEVIEDGVINRDTIEPCFIYDWVVLHQNRLSHGEEEAGREYLKYRKEIERSPIFLVRNIIEDKGIKVHSKKYLTPIKNLFREIGLLEEKRGKFRKEDLAKEGRDAQIIQLYREIVKKTKRKRPLPVSSIFRRMDGYEISEATIRRVLNKAGY